MASTTTATASSPPDEATTTDDGVQAECEGDCDDARTTDRYEAPETKRSATAIDNDCDGSVLGPG